MLRSRLSFELNRETCDRLYFLHHIKKTFELSLFIIRRDQSARQGEPGTVMGDEQVALGAVGCLILGHYAHRRQPGRC